MRAHTSRGSVRSPTPDTPPASARFSGSPLWRVAYPSSKAVSMAYPGRCRRRGTAESWSNRTFMPGWKPSANGPRAPGRRRQHRPELRPIRSFLFNLPYPPTRMLEKTPRSWSVHGRSRPLCAPPDTDARCTDRQTGLGDPALQWRPALSGRVKYPESAGVIPSPSPCCHACSSWASSQALVHSFTVIVLVFRL